MSVLDQTVEPCVALLDAYENTIPIAMTSPLPNTKCLSNDFSVTYPTRQVSLAVTECYLDFQAKDLQEWDTGNYVKD